MKNNLFSDFYIFASEFLSENLNTVFEKIRSFQRTKDLVIINRSPNHIYVFNFYSREKGNLVPDCDIHFDIGFTSMRDDADLMIGIRLYKYEHKPNWAALIESDNPFINECSYLSHMSKAIFKLNEYATDSEIFKKYSDELGKVGHRLSKFLKKKIRKEFEIRVGNVSTSIHDLDNLVNRLLNTGFRPSFKGGWNF